MSTKPNTGGPVFAQTNVPYSGMSLRAWLAGMAMQGLCLKATGTYDEGPCNSAIAGRSIKLADLMLAELEKDNP